MFGFFRTDKDKEKVLLPGYEHFTHLVGMFLLVLFIVLTLLLPDKYVAFTSDRMMLLYALLPALITSATIFGFLKLEEQKKYFFLIEITWTGSFFVVVYLTSGIYSPFVILFIFSLLAAAEALDSRRIMRVATVVSVLYVAMILLYPNEVVNPAAWFPHLSITALYLCIAFYLSRIVKETLRHKYEKDEANKRYFQLAEADRVKSDFLTVISHQLRSPLTGARYALTSYAEAKDQQLRDALVKQALLRVDKLNKIVNEMLKTFELGQRAMGNESKNFDAVAALREVIDGLRDEREATGVNIILDAPKECTIYGNPELIKVALLYLIENAVRYSPAGEVRVSLTTHAPRVRITVSDNGIGIYPNDIPHIFDRFYRAHNAMALFPNESGIGLFTAQQIARRHSGGISLISSAPGKGTTIRMDLPFHTQ